MNAAKRREIFLRLQAQNPHPTTELVFQTPFELLIAVLLSAQATDISVNAATRVLYPLANTPQAILDLGEEKLRQGQTHHADLQNFAGAARRRSAANA
jgi:endonuclease-3